MEISDAEQAVKYANEHYGDQDTKFEGAEELEIATRTLGMKVWKLGRLVKRAGSDDFDSLEGGTDLIAADGTFFNLSVKRRSDEEQEAAIQEAYQKAKS
jgi:hypothetical protein